MSGPESTMKFLTVDVSDADCAALCKSAGRMAALLRDQIVAKDDAAVPTLDFFAGGIHSLLLARHHGYKDRTTRVPRTEPIQTLSDELSNGQLRIDGDWLAGYHFNSGLARLAAVYERSMKIAAAIRDQQEKKAVVERAAGDAYAMWTDGKVWHHSKIELVYKEVNRLKHRAEGGKERIAQYHDARLAVDEILTLLEAWRDARCPR